MATQGITFGQVVSRGCGIDVHKDTVVATIKGEGIVETTKTFQTFTSSLTDLHDWLKTEGVTHVAMESTGVYWKPVYSVLEEGLEIILVNARHIKNVPGHKTDKKDSAWIAKLLLSGLLKASFIPPIEIRDLRELFRYRRKLKGQHSSEANRIQKVLEEANIKLGSVLSDVLGVSGSKIINDLIEGKTDVEELIKHCHGKIKASRADIKESLKGKITEHHRFMLGLIRESMESIDKLIAKVDQQIDEKSEFCKQQIEDLSTIPGVSKLTAQGIICEIGIDMGVFPNEHHLASWAGVSPGNNESAGKKKSTRTVNGNQHLRVTLVEASWAASRTKNTYLRSKYESLISHKGKKKALIAIGHKILVAAYFILRDNKPYVELGHEYLLQKRKTNQVNNYLRKLKEIGFEVELKI